VPQLIDIALLKVGAEALSVRCFEGSGLLISWTTSKSAREVLLLCAAGMSESTIDLLFDDDSHDQQSATSVLAAASDRTIRVMKITSPTIADAIGYRSGPGEFGLVTVVTPDQEVDGPSRLGKKHLVSMIVATGSAMVSKLHEAEIDKVLYRAKH
jgi:hypothetical protein